MNKEELLFWNERYRLEEGPYEKKKEDRLGEKFRKNKFATKADLISVVKWKFQGRLIGRQRRILKFLEGVDDKFVCESSKLVFQTKDDELRLKILNCIKGFGFALGSVILAFYDPNNYGVLDIHAWRGLFGKEPKDLFTNIKRPIQFFNKLREISMQTGLSCRDIEKAFFEKDFRS